MCADHQGVAWNIADIGNVVLAAVEALLALMGPDESGTMVGWWSSTLCNQKATAITARGLKYLYQEKKLLHGDIKSSNVVFKGYFETSKTYDVGVSLPPDMTGTDPEAYYIGTEPWKSKDALENDDDDEDKTFDESDFDDETYYVALGSRPSINMEELDDMYQKEPLAPHSALTLVVHSPADLRSDPDLWAKAALPSRELLGEDPLKINSSSAAFSSILCSGAGDGIPEKYCRSPDGSIT
ncbi:Lymphokine-activated killer T-cell-originated protein kinase [Myotis davidii]|uniref:Lymphokine-activated killer T-cell-originated protein kinase n=1 Tax=Myotis davidii TaxID=225400 RepID=L5LQ93_MYODS|nr:Lymphokine-activated killer T-cell-originated protein kinase [Myotis davidii]